MDWEQRYLNEDTPWCKGRGHPMLEGLIDSSVPQDFSGRIVVPGCGRAWDLAAIAAARPCALVLGIDLSETALNAVPSDIRKNPQIELMVGDFLDTDWVKNAVGKADCIWEHTCFCAIHPSRREDYVESAAAILSPGGILAGLFFIDLDDEGSGPPWNCPQLELRRLFGASFQIRSCEIARDTFEGRHGEEYAVQLCRRSELQCL